MIKASKLTKIYKIEDVETVALSNVSFEIKKRRVRPRSWDRRDRENQLLMHILGALDLPTSGEYILDGENVSKLDEDELSRY